VFDDLHFSGEEKASAKIAVFNAHAELAQRILEYETKLVEAQARVITAESSGESWLQRNWRPFTMMTFVFIIAWNHIIYPLLSWASDAKIPQVLVPDGLWTLIQICLSGYVAGRSAEKIADMITSSENVNINLGSGKK
jgi:hypothetical protein